MDVELFDGAIGTYTPKNYAQRLLRGYALVAIWCECVADVPNALALINLIRAVSPRSSIIVYGDGSIYARKLFEHYRVNAIHATGDYELAILEYYKYLECSTSTGAIANVALLSDGAYKPPLGTQYLDGSDWAFPPLEQLPLAEYAVFVGRQGDWTKTLNCPDVIALSVSRGCPYNCTYCPTRYREGMRDRRRPIDLTVEWLRNLPSKHRSVMLVSPTFTLDRAWVLEFCESLSATRTDISWKVSTRVDLLDEELLLAMRRAGCETICFGVESLQITTGNGPKASYGDIRGLARALRKHQIIGRAYIMIGYPGQSRQDAFFTLQALRDEGLVVRPTGYTPFHQLLHLSVDELEATDLRAYDRRTYYDPQCGLTREEFYRCILQQDA